MAAFLRSLFHIQATLFIFLLQHSGLAQEQDQFIYTGFSGAKLNLSGIARIQPNGLLQLTADAPERQIGRAFFPFPLSFNNASSNSLSFSTYFVFAIVPERRRSGGHGFAFTIAPYMEQSGAVAAQYFGLLNSSSYGLPSNHLFAIEFDTIESPDLGDIDDNHVGIDINNLRSIESAPATYFQENGRKNESLNLMSGAPIQVWIDYDGEEKILNVTLAPMRSTRPNRPLLSRRLDLSMVFLSSMYIGFSSSTGTLTSNHYILGWSFNKTGEAQGLEMSKLPQVPPGRKKTKDKSRLRIIISSTTVTALLVIICGAAYIAHRKKYEEVREDWEQEYGPQRFSYKDLYVATKGFKDTELLGSGGFGSVYRGVLPYSDGQVAVKRVSHNSKQGMEEFVAEIVSMGRLRHRNLVQLLGYCRRKGELLLVYDYMPNGSLDKFLFSNEKPNLTWVQRFQILRGVASALFYLHEEWEQLVLHRDIKASNILLDENFNGRLGDFGLAKLYDRDTNSQTTRVVGTVGYIAPELAQTGKATTKTDVFAFGTFTLEMACGRKPLESERSPEETMLVDWVLECWKRGAILEAIDARLETEEEGGFAAEEVEAILKLGLLCTHQTAAARPSMRQVVQYLDGNTSLPEITLDNARIGIIRIGNTATASSSLGETGIVSEYPTTSVSTAKSFSSNLSILSSGR